MIADDASQAFGKTILFGEHAVVWGKRALACGLPIGMTGESASSDTFQITVPNWDFHIDADEISIHGDALRALLKHIPDAAPLTIRVTAAIPPRAGLGSSAALAACILKTILNHHRKTISFDEQYGAVQAWETVFHGTPSGVDATLALKGGLLLFSKQEGATPVSAEHPKLMVVHSGSPGDTRTTVARFAHTMSTRPAEGQKRLTRISQIVEEGYAALMSNDMDTLGALMSENHRHLMWFGISTPALDKIVTVAQKAGALGAKLTGGGGGGSAIILLKESHPSVQHAVARAGFSTVFE